MQILQKKIKNNTNYTEENNIALKDIRFITDNIDDDDNNTILYKVMDKTYKPFPSENNIFINKAAVNCYEFNGSVSIDNIINFITNCITNSITNSIDIHTFDNLENELNTIVKNISDERGYLNLIIVYNENNKFIVINILIAYQKKLYFFDKFVCKVMVLHGSS